jgi:nucleoside-diphosphate-sugar epimerase
MRIYITGASGFVGKRLVDNFRKKNFEVVPIVRKRTGDDSEIQIDFSKASENELYNVFNKADCIIHLAAHPDFSTNFSYENYQINCIANLRLINISCQLNIHFVFASNALISGVSSLLINSETKDSPDIPYNIAKYISEQFLVEKLEKYTILRLGGIYGIKGPQHLYLNKAITKLIQDKTSPIINNDGLGMRNYIYVEDLCEWIYHIVENKIFGKILIAGPETLTLKAIFSNLCDVFLGHYDELKYNEHVKGESQIIETRFPNIKLHRYREAFEQMKINLENENSDSI